LTVTLPNNTWEIGSPNPADVIAKLDDNGTLTISGTGTMQDWQPWWVINPPDIPWWNVMNEITRVVINNGVTTIGNSAFFHCNSLTSITIPNSVTKIGENVFIDNYSLTDVTVSWDIPLSISSDRFCNVNLSIANLHVPDGTQCAYSADPIWQYFNIVKPSQTINFQAISTKTYGDAPITLPQTTDAGLTISYQSSNEAVATVSGNILTITGVGTTVITATQDGSCAFAAATPVTQSLTVNPLPTYGVSIGTFSGGTVTADKTSAPANETVTLTITPDSGYELDAISAYNTSSPATIVTLNGSGSIRTFTMPAYGVTVTATFKITQEQLDSEAVATAKAAIEGGSYTATQTVANTEAALKTWLAAQINSLITSTGIIVTEADITLSNFTAASNGANGSFDFSVDISKGSANDSAAKTGNSISATPVYNVLISSMTKGSVSTDKTTVTAGETVTLTITPVAGYELDAISAYNTSNPATIVTLNGSGNSFTFTMPAYGVTVTATFKETQEQLDKDALETVKAAIEGGTYSIQQATGNTETDVRTWLVNTLNELYSQAYGVQFRSTSSVILGDVTITALTPAIAGTESNPAGTNGSFIFTVSLDKDGTTLTTGEVPGVIVATSYIIVKSIELTQPSDLSLSVRIINTGNIATGDLALALSGANANDFTLSAATIGSLGVGEEADVTLIPLNNLPEGTYTATLTVSGEGLESKWIEITYIKTNTGVDTVSNHISIFPNPVTSDLYIKSDLPIERVEVCSLAGTLVMLEKNVSEKISVAALSKGVYLLKVYTGKGVAVSKVVKE